MDEPKLRGMIAEHFGSQKKMAEFLGWSQARLHRILKGKQSTTTDDVFAMAQALDLLGDPERIVSIFIT